MTSTPTHHYATGTNIPGCLPTPGSVKAFRNWDDAHRWLLGELMWDEDHAETEAQAESIRAAAEDVNLWPRNGTWSVTVHNIAYWISAVPGPAPDEED